MPPLYMTIEGIAAIWGADAPENWGTALKQRGKIGQGSGKMKWIIRILWAVERKAGDLEDWLAERLPYEERPLSNIDRAFIRQYEAAIHKAYEVARAKHVAADGNVEKILKYFNGIWYVFNAKPLP